MTSVTISVKGAEEVKRNMDRFLKIADRELALRMTLIVRKVAADAKRLAPVDTGFLRRNITHSVGRKRTYVIGKVSSLAFYSGYQEFGVPGRHGAQPFMRPALMENFKMIEREIKAAMLSAMFAAQTKKGLGIRKISF